MTTLPNVINEVAERFVKLDEAGQPMEPVASLAPDLSAEEAYQAQQIVVYKFVERGDKVVGKKTGVTSEAAQAQLGLTEPAYGHLFQSQQIADGGVIPIAHLIRPVVECEITFRLGKELAGPGVTPDDVLAATETVVASLEIVDFRSQTVKPGMQEVLAYNVFAKYFVLGANPTPVEELDLVNLGVTLKKNGEPIASSTGVAVMGNPAASVAWLVNKAAEHNIKLKAGEIVLSGTLTPPEPAQAGDHMEASFEGLGTASVSFE